MAQFCSDLPLNTSWLSSTLLSSPLDILTNSCWWDVDSFPQTCVIRAMRRGKHTGAHRCWRTQKFPHCPSLSMLFSYHTHGNKMNKLQLLTRTDNGFTSAVYFSRKISIPTTLVAQWGCGSIRRFRRTVIRKSAAKQTGGDVCFNIKRCKTSGAQSSLLNQDSALSSWKRCLSLQAILLALGVCFNHFCCCVHLPSGKSKWHAMSTIRTDNKNENQTSDSTVFIQGKWRN